MGADGHITIWSRENTLKTFPDCAQLFQCLPTHYCDELCGALYDHVYYGDNLGIYWWEENEWYLSYANKVGIERLREFVDWLESPESKPTEWEVWT